MSLIQQALEKTGKIPKTPAIEYPVQEEIKPLKSKGVKTGPEDSKEKKEKVSALPPVCEELSIDLLRKTLREQQGETRRDEKPALGARFFEKLKTGRFSRLIPAAAGIFSVLLLFIILTVIFSSMGKSAPARGQGFFFSRSKGGLHLTGITTLKGRKYALINNRIYTIGDKIDETTVLNSIHDKTVKLKKGNRDFVLNL